MHAVLATLIKWFENFYKNKLHYYFFLIIKYVLISSSRDNNKTIGMGTTVLGLHIDKKTCKKYNKHICRKVSSRCFAIWAITPFISGTLKITYVAYLHSITSYE